MKPAIKTIEGVRFEESVTDADAKKIAYDLAHADFQYSPRDIRTPLEHLIVGGTCPFARPLTPLAYLAGRMSLEEVNTERLERTNNSISWNRCGAYVSADVDTRNALYSKVHHITGSPIFIDPNMNLYELAQLNTDVTYRGKKVSLKLRKIKDNCGKDEGPHELNSSRLRDDTEKADAG